MKRYLAEFIGAFFLVFVGAGAIIADVFRSRALVTDSFGLLGIAIAHGLALAVVIAAIVRISGGYANPAVSIALWVARRISAVDLLWYVVFQLLGGVAAAFLLKGLVPTEAFSNAGAGIPAVAEGMASLKAVAFEGVLTFFLVFVIWGVAVDKKGPKPLGPFAVGLTLTFGVLVGGTFTGAAMNPARWFGPALASGQWSNAFVYIAGPILGALLASLVYEVFFLEEEEPEHGDIAVDEESARDWSDTPSPLLASDREPEVGAESPLTPPEPMDEESIPTPRRESAFGGPSGTSPSGESQRSPSMGASQTSAGPAMSAAPGSSSMGAGPSGDDVTPEAVGSGRMADTESEGMDRPATDQTAEGTSEQGTREDETRGSTNVMPGSASAPGPTGSSEMPPAQSDDKPETEKKEDR